MREVHPGDGERDRERGERAEGDDRFGAELAKGQPDHGRGLGRGWVVGGAGHVGQDEVFEVEVFDGPGWVEDRPVGAHDQGGLPGGVAFDDDLLVFREGVGVAAGP